MNSKSWALAALLTPFFFVFIAAYILFASLGIGALAAGALFGVIQWGCKQLMAMLSEME